MQCSKCKAPTEDESVYCGQCGKQFTQPGRPVMVAFAPQPDRLSRLEAPWLEQAENEERPLPFPEEQVLPFQADKPYTQIYPKTPIPLPGRRKSLTLPHLALPFRQPHSSRFRHKSLSLLTFMLIVLLLGIAIGAITLLQNKHLSSDPAHATGNITFSDSSASQSDSGGLTLTLSGLAAPPSGSHYAAWLVDERVEQTTALGTLTKVEQSATPGYVLVFHHSGTNLLGSGNKFEITQETGSATLPAGKVLLTASYPELAFLHIKHLLVSFATTPGNVGLLVGLRDQGQQVQAQAQSLKNSEGKREETLCNAQSLLNLLEGTDGAHFHSLPPSCVQASRGDGFGLLGQGGEGYLSMVAMHASLAATQSDATDTIRTHAQKIIQGTDQLKKWFNTIDQDAQSLLTDPTNHTKIQEISQLASSIMNGDQHTAGIISLYHEGQSMATLTFVPDMH
ncbi:hypothetical protein [Tengunoibacter tsumagoiensis]|uniref:Uncharacterized protein n=1 Tax=Tengunoibacter tsumagoiensis TaxID=2014871 RepID=A0A401ZV42_9CHLR|nr:hypothetical protein [Tengunoibacter tsumagoiensis]GCE10779.1 hypothetical protein KTT_06380 [Tengunoibacter tsumagoiensis]